MSEAVLFIREVIERKSLSHGQQSSLIAAVTDKKFDFKDCMNIMMHSGDVCLIRYAADSDPTYCAIFTGDKMDIHVVDPKMYIFIESVRNNREIVNERKAMLIKACVLGEISPDCDKVGVSVVNRNLYYTRKNFAAIYYAYITDKIIIGKVHRATNELITYNLFGKVIDDMLRDKYEITQNTNICTKGNKYYLWEQDTFFPAFMITDSHGEKITPFPQYVPYILKMYNARIPIPRLFDISIAVHRSPDVFFSQPADNIKSVTYTNDKITLTYEDGTKDEFSTHNNDFRPIDNDKNNALLNAFVDTQKKIVVDTQKKVEVDEFAEFPSSAELVASAQEKVKEHILQKVKGRKSITLTAEHHFDNHVIKAYIARLCAAKQYNFTDINNTITLTFL